MGRENNIQVDRRREVAICFPPATQQSNILRKMTKLRAKDSSINFLTVFIINFLLFSINDHNQIKKGTD